MIWTNLNKSEIKNNPVWVLPNVWGLGASYECHIWNVSNKMLLNTEKLQGYGFYRFWVIEEKPAQGMG